MARIDWTRCRKVGPTEAINGEQRRVSPMHPGWEARLRRQAAGATLPTSAEPGKVYCRHCGTEIELVQVDGAWQQRDGDGMPHTLTCGAA